METPTGFSVDMGWVWRLKSNPDGSPGISTAPVTTGIGVDNCGTLGRVPTRLPTI